MIYKGDKPIDTMYVGSKLVQQVYKGSKKVYPEHGVIPKAIKDSMVLWYDIKRQGATNENMAANPTLRDLSGNGHDATCYNFAWSRMSGVGGYGIDASEIKSSNNSLYNVLNNGNEITVSRKDENLNLRAGDAFAYYRKSLLSEKLTLYAGAYGLGIIEIDASGSYITIFRINPNETATFHSSLLQNENSDYIFFAFIEDMPAGHSDTFGILPEYPNALVSDGVDDYAKVTGLLLLDDFTVITKAKSIKEAISNNGIAFSKRKASVEIDGAFTFYRYNSNNNIIVNSFGYNNTINPEYVIKDGIIYITKNSHNGMPIQNGNLSDTDSFYIFSVNQNYEFGSMALYSVILFNRTLTTEEIEWVKTNLIEGNDDEADWYGVEFYTTSDNPDCVRIGNPELHKTLPVHSQMKGCLLADDGTVNKYLNETDWTGETLDGSQGQVMVEMPKQSYWKFETDGNIRRVKFSTKPLPGFKPTPQGYVSAYEASVQRSTNKLASVVNTTADYRGGNNNAGWDGTYRSLLGMPATNISRTYFRNYARNRKADSTEWNCMTYDAQKDLYWLFVVEYATLNSQKAFNAAKTAEGYAQGGLGKGVTSLDETKWNTFNGYYPVIPCGHTDSLGNGTGEVDYQMPEEYDTNVLTVKVPRYRGIENPFGHLWQWTDGINVRISPNEPDGDGLSKVYVCSDPSKFNDTNYDGYTYVGDEVRTHTYVKEVIFGEGGEIMPSVVGGSTTTYFCDYHYTNIPTAETLRGVLFGGAADGVGAAGFVCASSNRTPSSAAANLGSRLCFIPNNND